MKRVYRTLRRYVAPLAVVATAVVLVATIHFTRTELPWATFLTGVFSASVLALATRVSRSEWALARRSARLSLVQEKLARESGLRQKAEQQVAVMQPRLRLVDEELSTMVVQADAGGRCVYHNRAFREWLNLASHQIDGRPLRSVLGPKIFGEMAADIRQVMTGRTVEASWVQPMANGAVYRLSARYLPHFGEHSAVAGFHALISDLTDPSDVRAPAPAAAVPADPESEAAGLPRDAASRIMTALQHDEFRLFRQRIVALAAAPAEPHHYEVLIRLMEEEESMMPPGAFFPIAEKYGLMPHLDRWVVEHVVERAAESQSRETAAFFVNIASATVRDPEFPKFLGHHLRKHDVEGGRICFEIASADLALVHRDAVHFAQQVRAYGCRIAVSGFGRDPESLHLLRDFQLDFLKIHGSVILGLLRDPACVARVGAITRIARTIGVKTVAEMVEDEPTVAKLREAGVDFAQGFGIDRPQAFVR